MPVHTYTSNSTQCTDTGLATHILFHACSVCTLQCLEKTARVINAAVYKPTAACRYIIVTLKQNGFKALLYYAA